MQHVLRKLQSSREESRLLRRRMYTAPKCNSCRASPGGGGGGGPEAPAGQLTVGGSPSLDSSPLRTRRPGSSSRRAPAWRLGLARRASCCLSRCPSSAPPSLAAAATARRLLLSLWGPQEASLRRRGSVGGEETEPRAVSEARGWRAEGREAMPGVERGWVAGGRLPRLLYSSCNSRAAP